MQGLDKQVAKDKKQFYFKHLNLDTGEVIQGFTHELKLYEKELWKNPPLDCAYRLNESKYRKAKKVRDKISKIVYSGQAIFVTLTFSDDTLKNTSQATRRRYVARYLKSQCCNYAANIDYGSQNGREHYHAIVDKKLDHNLWSCYGAINFKQVRNTHGDVMGVSKYISKLTNHALKNKGLQPRLIYSRDIKNNV